MTVEEKRIFDLYNKSGWCAFHYPRRKQISLDGHPRIPEKQAIKEMRETLKMKGFLVNNSF